MKDRFYNEFYTSTENYKEPVSIKINDRIKKLELGGFKIYGSINGTKVLFRKQARVVINFDDTEFSEIDLVLQSEDISVPVDPAQQNAYAIVSRRRKKFFDLPSLFEQSLFTKKGESVI